MVSIKQVPVEKFISAVKEELKKIKEIQPPNWAKFVKSGVSKERPPEQEDFWYIRTASILRRTYIEGSVGVERLRTFYGSRKRFGHAPAHFRKSSGNIVRKILQQLEKVGFVEKNKKGRKISVKGKKFLEKIAKRC